VFRRFHGEFKDLVTILSTKVDPISYIDLHSHLLTNEFLYKSSLQSIESSVYYSAATYTSSALLDFYCPTSVFLIL
jgi:hypothetical protein